MMSSMSQRETNQPQLSQQQGGTEQTYYDKLMLIMAMGGMTQEEAHGLLESTGGSLEMAVSLLIEQQEDSAPPSRPNPTATPGPASVGAGAGGAMRGGEEEEPRKADEQKEDVLVQGYETRYDMNETLTGSFAEVVGPMEFEDERLFTKHNVPIFLGQWGVYLGKFPQEWKMVLCWYPGSGRGHRVLELMLTHASKAYESYVITYVNPNNRLLMDALREDYEMTSFPCILMIGPIQEDGQVEVECHMIDGTNPQLPSCLSTNPRTSSVSSSPPQQQHRGEAAGAPTEVPAPRYSVPIREMSEEKRREIQLREERQIRIIELEESEGNEITIRVRVPGASKPVTVTVDKRQNAEEIFLQVGIDEMEWYKYEVVGHHVRDETKRSLTYQEAGFIHMTVYTIRQL